MRTVKERAGELLKDVTDTVENSVSQNISEVTNQVNQRIRSVIEGSARKASDSIKEIASIDEKSILTYIDDRRQFSGLSSIFLALFLFILLPGWMAWLPAMVLVYGIITLYIFYVWRAKVDIPDGYEGVNTFFGRPVTDEKKKAKKGRNWYLSYPEFCLFMVSKQDQVISFEASSFAADYVRIGFEGQIMFKNADVAKIVVETTPSSIMKIINLYSRYILLRIITSIPDSRIKFIGRDNLQNLVGALNGYLSEEFGIEAKRATMPTQMNSILKDLEEIKTTLKEIELMKTETKKVRLESATKTVEGDMRQKRKIAYKQAILLQQKKISLDTIVSERINQIRQNQIIGARKRLEEASALLGKEVASYFAKIKKAMAVNKAIKELEASFDVEIAELKREVFKKLMPKKISVLGVKGIGTGVGLNYGHQIFESIHKRAVEDKMEKFNECDV
jgi:hypothetical protein